MTNEGMQKLPAWTVFCYLSHESLHATYECKYVNTYVICVGSRRHEMKHVFFSYAYVVFQLSNWSIGIRPLMWAYVDMCAKARNDVAAAISSFSVSLLLVKNINVKFNEHVLMRARHSLLDSRPWQNSKNDMSFSSFRFPSEKYTD